MGWICTKKMKIKRGGKYVELRGGDPVPEAEHWSTRKALERQRFIRWVDRPTPSPAEAKPVSAAVKPRDELLLGDPVEPDPELRSNLEPDEKPEPEEDTGKKKKKSSRKKRWSN